MKKGLRKLMSGVLAAAMVVTSAGVQSENVDAANKMASASKITMKVGAKKVIKIKNVTKKMKVNAKVNKPKVVKVTVKKKKIILKGKKVGKAKLTITVKKNGKKVTTIKRKIIVTAADATVTPAPATATTAAAAAKATATPATTAAAQATVAPEATAEATAEPTENPKEVKQLVTYDTTTNLLDEPVEKEIVGGYELTKNDDGVYEGTAKDSITIESYDNGEVRKDMSTQDLIKNEMGQGINVGNTMEATKAVADLSKYTEATQFEQAWGASLTSPEYIEALQTYGINTIRIPVAWASMTSDDGEYTISPKMLGRVEQIVNYALNAGMYVIVNDHWDYGWWGEFGQITKVESGENTNFWEYAGETTEFSWDVDGDGTEEIYKYNTEAMKRYTSYWKQITERFKGYSDHLIFESANEELGPNLNLPIGASGLTEDSGVKGSLGSDALYAVSNVINQTFVDLVRESGGNNAYRHLLIAGYNTNIKNTYNDKYVMPKDTEENGTTKLSVSVHFYDPWAYCGDGMKGASYKDSDYEAAIENFEL
ncbi:MAG: glycoside hydrolase family 5 protein, partial [Lachnospiraceae bacterium]|nr:glycoside hydrolase family 5 protein [Lachnospiraceae bacterium]